MSEAPAAAAPVTENGVPPSTQEKVVDEVPGFKVFAGNLAYSTTDEGLKAFFDPVKSDLVSAQVILRGTRSAGYGFVAFSTEAAAHKAVEVLNKKELDGRPIIVEVAKPADQKEKKPKKSASKRANRRGDKAVPGEVTEAEANGEVAEKPAEGEAPAADGTAKPKKKRKSSKKAKKTTEGETPAAEGAAAPSAETPAEGTAEKKPKAKKARTPKPRRPAGEDPAGEPSKTMLFVANLGFNLDDAGLEALFKDAGLQVTSARVVRRRWGNPRKSKGYGFVDVGGEEEQKKAIEVLQGKEVGGRQIAVKVAVNAQLEEEEKEAAAPSAEAPAAAEETKAAVVAS